MDIQRIGSRASSPGPDDWFTGRVRRKGSVFGHVVEVEFVGRDVC